MPTNRYQVFVSYSRYDRGLVTPITSLLKAAKVEVFRDEDSIPPGARWAEQISSALNACDTVFVFWSVHSRASAAVKEEWSQAVRLSKSVVPVLLDSTPLESTLAAYQWVDLRRFLESAAERIIGSILSGPVVFNYSMFESLRSAATDIVAALEHAARFGVDTSRLFGEPEEASIQDLFHKALLQPGQSE